MRYPNLRANYPFAITLTETENFLSADPATQTTINLPANTSAANTHIESFTTKPVNTKFEADSTVTLTINEVNRYVVNSTADSASVVIHDAQTPAGISVLAISNEITEGPDVTADFLIKSNEVSSSERKINVKIDDGSADFLSNRGDSIQTIPANSRSYLLNVGIVDDDVFEANGEIKVTILASGGSSDTYSVAGGTYNEASVAILDDDVPSSSSDTSAGISIVEIEGSVAESDTADFQVTAKSALSSNRTIRVQVDDGAGDFIDVDNQQSEYSYDKATKVFLVSLPANQQTATLNVVLADDSKNEANGTLTATVLADTNQTPTYVLASSGITANITATDNDPDVPILSIRSDAAGVDGTGVTEGFSFKFKVRSNEVISGSALPIDVSADDGTASLGLTIVGTKEVAVGSQETEFTVTMNSSADVAPNSNVNIVVSLAEHADYDTNPARESITIKVKDNDTPSASNPTITISGPHYVEEGQPFNITLTPSHAPSSDITVNLDLKATQGNFLASSQLGVNPVPISSGSNSKEHLVVTVAEAAANSDGRITAEVLEGNGYALSADSAPRNAEFVVYDALPVISLSAPDSVSEADGSFDITLTSDIIPVQNHPITITSLNVDDSAGQSFDYFDSIPTRPIIIDHNSANRTVTIPVTLTTNRTYDGWGEITATLTDGLDYKVNPNADAKSVEIVDDDPAPHAVSISAPVSVVEGDDIVVKLEASPVLASGQSLRVNFQAEDVTGTYLDYTSLPVTITNANSSSTTLNIGTRDDTARSENGEIRLKIVRGDGYELGSIATKNVTVLDKALLPSITISAVNAGPIDEGETAVFNLVATPTPDEEIMVSVQVDHAPGTTGNFLDTDDIKTHVVPVSTAGTGELRINTVSDGNSEDDGSIQATLKDDPKGENNPNNVNRLTSATYIVGTSNNSATVAIADNDTAGLPIVTISGADSIDEGATATFTLTAASIGAESITVRVRITQVGSFISRDLSATNEFTFTIPADGDTPGQYNIDEATLADAVDEDDGSITIRILSDPAVTDTYNVGEKSSHSTTVVDDDDSSLPNISIAGGTNVVEGADAAFTITATQAGSATSVPVRVQISESGNFLTNAAGINPVTVNVGATTPYNVSTSDDAYDEFNGSITATILKDDAQTARYGIGENISANVQVSDNDDPPTISISVDPVTEGNDPNTNAEMIFTVTISEQSHQRHQCWIMRLLRQDQPSFGY